MTAVSTHALHAAVEDRHWWFVGRRRIVAAVVRRIRPPEGHPLVLDVGCGTGANLAAFAGDYAVLGVDASEEAVARAQGRFPRIPFLRGDVPPREAAGRAGVLLLLDVLEHVDDERAFLGALVEALPPGAHLVCTVPADPALWSPHDTAFGHRRRYTREALTRLWTDLPVAERLVTFFNTRLLPLVRAVRSRTAASGAAFGEAGTDFRMPPAPANALLARILAGESRRILSALDGRVPPYARGASLLAVLRREPA